MPRFYVHTFGCQMNVHDSDRMAEMLRSRGWEAAEGPEAADVVVLNTCSVRDKAEQKLRSELGRLAILKHKRPELVLVVAGCVAQQEGDRLLAREPALDLVIGPDNIPELPGLLAARQRTSVTAFDMDAPRFLPAAPQLGQAPISAFVTTMKGCDERCSFCIVPYTRGPERYRPASDIVEECRRFVDAGAREIVLLGQTVDSFRDPALPPADSEAPGTGREPNSLGVWGRSPHHEDPDETQFPQLLRRIAQDVPGLLRLRYTSPHPRHATPSLAKAHAELDVLAKHVHLPVQSGSDRVLRRMIRRYTRAEYIARASRLREARPGLTLSTDLIVGFPGETDEDFEQTLSLVREVGFVSLFAFKYSPRPFTPALKLREEVPEETKAARLAALLELGNELTEKHLAGLVGTKQRVLVCAPGRAPRTYEGRTEANEIVHVSLHNSAPTGGSAPPAPPDSILGTIVEVTVTRAFKHSLEAGGSTRRALPVLASPA